MCWFRAHKKMDGMCMCMDLYGHKESGIARYFR